MQQHPDLVMMYNQTKAELDRQQAARNPRQPSQGPLSNLSGIAGNALIALGTRIAPAPRPIVTRQPVRPALAR